MTTHHHHQPPPLSPLHMSITSTFPSTHYHSLRGFFTPSKPRTRHKSRNAQITELTYNKYKKAQMMVYRRLGSKLGNTVGFSYSFLCQLTNVSFLDSFF